MVVAEGLAKRTAGGSDQFRLVTSSQIFAILSITARRAVKTITIYVIDVIDHIVVKADGSLATIRTFEHGVTLRLKEQNRDYTI